MVNRKSAQFLILVLLTLLIVAAMALLSLVAQTGVGASVTPLVLALPNTHL